MLVLAASCSGGKHAGTNPDAAAATDAASDSGLAVGMQGDPCTPGELRWCSCAGVYRLCEESGILNCHCGIVVAGGDAGSALPDPGTLFVEIEVRSLVADPTRNTIYAGRNLPPIVAFSPETGLKQWEVVSPGLFLPERLAISDDGSKLYAADHSHSWIERIDVATRAVDVTIDLDPPTESGPPTYDLAVPPGAPRTVIASIARSILVLDDDVLRPGQATTSVAAFLGARDASTGYALFRDGSLAKFALTPAGISPASVAATTEPLSQPFEDVVFDGEWAFSDDGTAVDPERGVVVGRYDSRGPIAVDRTGGRVYIIPSSRSDDPLIIVEYDRSTFARRRTLTLAPRGYWSQIVRAVDGTFGVRGSFTVTSPYPGFLLIRPEAWAAAVAP